MSLSKYSLILKNNNNTKNQSITKIYIEYKKDN